MSLGVVYFFHTLVKLGGRVGHDVHSSYRFCEFVS